MTRNQKCEIAVAVEHRKNVCAKKNEYYKHVGWSDNQC